MKNRSFGQGLMAFFVVVGVLFIVGSIVETRKPKCVEIGCDNEQARGSRYCYLHKPYTGSSSSSHTSSSYGSKSSGSSSVGSTSNSSSSSGSYSNSSKTTTNSSYSSSTSKKNSYDSYDDGYDDIYMDGDYDYDRYERDSDYADGVDDAMDEFGEDY